MRFCPSCDRHVFDGTITCPFCQAPCGTVRGGSLAILGITLGVALTACVESKSDVTDSTSFTTTFDPDDSLDAWGGTYTVSGDSPWSTTRPTSTGGDTLTTTGTTTGTGTDTDTGTTGADTGTEAGTSTMTDTETGTSATTGTDTGTSTTDVGTTGTSSSSN